MPSLCLLVIQECEGGVAIDQLPIQKGTPLERQCAGVLDLGLRLAGEALSKELSRHADKPAQIVEGANIEQYIKAGLKDVGGIDFRQLLKEAGYEIKDKDYPHE